MTKSLSNLASTAHSRMNCTTSVLTTHSSNVKSQILRTSADILARRKNSLSQQNLLSFSSKDKLASQMKTFRKIKQSFLLIDDMLTKDKIEQIINEPDTKMQSLLRKRSLSNVHETSAIKSSRISFIVQPEKSQRINRK